MIAVLLSTGSIVAVTEAQQTQRALTALIALLLVVAAMLALLTIWYWRHTSPKRRMARYGTPAQHYIPEDYPVGFDQQVYAEPTMVDLDGGYSDAGQGYYR